MTRISPSEMERIAQATVAALPPKRTYQSVFEAVKDALEKRGAFPEHAARAAAKAAMKAAGE